MTTTTTRRAILAGVAAVPALSLPAIAAVPDPIFAALDRCRAAWDADRAAGDATGNLQELLPDDVRTWRWFVGQPTMPTDPAGDDPRWIAAESANALAGIEDCLATVAMVSTRPTTLPGLAALINCVRDREAAGYDFLGEQFNGRCDQDGKPLYAISRRRCSTHWRRPPRHWRCSHEGSRPPEQNYETQENQARRQAVSDGASVSANRGYLRSALRR
jgi:hypothetical protein